jgi:hypothetical protein
VPSASEIIQIILVSAVAAKEGTIAAKRDFCANKAKEMVLMGRINWCQDVCLDSESTFCECTFPGSGGEYGVLGREQALYAKMEGRIPKSLLEANCFP